MRAVRQIAGALNEMRQTGTPSSYVAAGKTIKCSHCGSDVFRKRRIVVRGPLAHCLICATCGLVVWFESAPSAKTRSGSQTT
jgi:hypothetical protein